jgi:hypothetical protein
MCLRLWSIQKNNKNYCSLQYKLQEYHRASVNILESLHDWSWPVLLVSHFSVCCSYFYLFLNNCAVQLVFSCLTLVSCMLVYRLLPCLIWPIARFPKHSAVCDLSFRYSRDQIFSGDLASYNEVSTAIPDGNWTFQLTAPNGGVAAFAVLASNISNELFSVGFTCDESKSNFSVCRKACCLTSITLLWFSLTYLPLCNSFFFVGMWQVLWLLCWEVPYHKQWDNLVILLKLR